MKRPALRLFRLSNGLTQSQMAAKLGISEGHYKHIERGIHDPSYKLMEKFVEAFGPSINIMEILKCEK